MASIVELRKLIETDRAAAKKILKKAFVEARCSKTDAASSLGCERSVFDDLAKRLRLVDWMRQARILAKRDGWHHEKTGGAGTHAEVGKAASAATEVLRKIRAARRRPDASCDIAS